MADGGAVGLGDLGAPAAARGRDYRPRLEAFFRAAAITDPAEAAGGLSAHFATLSEVLSADPVAVADYAGSAAANAVSTAKALMLWSLEEGLVKRRAVHTQAAAADFLKALIGFRCEELLVVLFLDSRRRLIDHETVAVGRPDSVEFDVRRILLRAIGRGASGIIVAHNHPSGDPKPSRSDIDVTRRLADASQALGICLHDHLVVAGGEVRSAMFD